MQFAFVKDLLPSTLAFRSPRSFSLQTLSLTLSLYEPLRVTPSPLPPTYATTLLPLPSFFGGFYKTVYL